MFGIKEADTIILERSICLVVAKGQSGRVSVAPNSDSPYSLRAFGGRNSLAFPSLQKSYPSGESHHHEMKMIMVKLNDLNSCSVHISEQGRRYWLERESRPFRI